MARWGCSIFSCGRLRSIVFKETIMFGRPLTASLALLLSASAFMPGEAAARADISPGVWQALEDEETPKVWVHLHERADLGAAERIFLKEDRGRFVYETLRQTAENSQANLAALLDSKGVNYRSFWITNALLVEADGPLVEILASRPEVERLTSNPWIYMLRDYRAEDDMPENAEAIEWNVSSVGAPQAWAQGFAGQGIVIATADTGVDWDHAALVNSYRGSEGLQVSHDYNWWDGVREDAEPYDDHGHGTFVTGQMTGEEGGNQIGVAPDAQWIGCKNMNAAGFGSPESYTSCFEFFIAPTDTRGRNPDPALAPHVINNSWGCPPAEGCDAETIKDITMAVQAAGILQVVSAGNSGPSCRSVSDPPAIYDEVLTVGAHDKNGSIAGFSSRGPSTYDRNVKPDISAPGVAIRSSATGGGYASGWSGTSMAAPEVAAAAAIIWSANPALIGDIEGTQTVLTGSATSVRAFQCGVSRTDGNNTWGHGKLDIPAALDLALQ